MNRRRFDILIVADLRTGCVSPSLAEEIQVQSRTGYLSALLPVISQRSPRAASPDPAVRDLVRAGDVTLVAPHEAVQARLAIVRDPSSFRQPLAYALDVLAERRIVLATCLPAEPESSRTWYPPAEVQANLERSFGAPWEWVPLDSVVRSSLEGPPGRRLVGEDWYETIDPARWRVERGDGLRDPISVSVAPPQGRRFIGPWRGRLRSALNAHPGVRLVPTNAATYADEPALRLHGEGGLSFHERGRLELWRRLDVLVDLDEDAWNDVAARRVTEAMAAGVVVILPPPLASVYGDAARYATSDQAPELLGELASHPREVVALRDAATEFVRSRCGHRDHLARVRQLVGPPRHAGVDAVPSPRATATEQPAQRILFFTDNSHGLGHITRLLAVARRCPEGFQPVFLTMSEAHSVIREAGFPAEYIPSSRRLGVKKDDWEPMLGLRLSRMIERVRPVSVIVDHVAPPRVIADVRARFPQVRFVWSRRGLWKPGRNYLGIELENGFDEVIEPVDVASAVDAGYTAVAAHHVHHVAPITLLDRSDLLPREAARRELAIPADGRAALIQLSDSGSDSLRRLIERARDGLRSAGIDHLFAPLHLLHAGLEPVDGVIMRPIYPLSQYLLAFDLAVSTAGYNSFHEIVMAGLPAVFVARRADTVDDQYRRARFATSAGFGWHIEAVDGDLDAIARRALDPLEAALVRKALAAIYPGNGAWEAASRLTDTGASELEVAG